MMIDFDKYNPLKSQEPTAPKLKNWKDSAPVMCLSEYLKLQKNHGIHLYRTSEGKPSLCFEPGLNHKDWQGERYRVATEAARLLLAAADDLKYLISEGLIALPIAKSKHQ
jgi:hypothetical protein